MANRRSYKKDEQLLTRILLADVAVFALYLLFAGLGVTAMKVITAIIAIILSGLCLGFLYMTGETKKKRSRWLVMGFGAIVLLVLVSLLLKYPAPAAKDAADAAGKSSTSTSEAADPSGTAGTTEASEGTTAAA